MCVLCCETFHFVCNLIKLGLGGRKFHLIINVCLITREPSTENFLIFICGLSFALWNFFFFFIPIFLFHCSKINWKTFFYFPLSSAHVVVVVFHEIAQFEKINIEFLPPPPSTPYHGWCSQN